ncbi:hypothetical protein [Streptomyces sp. NPDC051211]|uniref:hypothetical protein n=1 Tax=Streptomyces sp. NPDC051211 TaxID=3154643 RepID=UPI0034502B90
MSFGIGAPSLDDSHRSDVQRALLVQRLEDVRERYGAGTPHWWFFDRGDGAAFDFAGSRKVSVSGERVGHDRVRPTSSSGRYPPPAPRCAGWPATAS